jgi:hypothetical protein
MGDWSEAGAMSESAQTPAATNAPSTARSGAGKKLGRAPAIAAAVGGLLIIAAIGMVLRKADVGLPASDTAPPTGD